MTFTKTLARWLITALFIATSPIATWAQGQNSITNVVTTPHVRAELMAHAPDGADPGKTVWVGLQLNHIPEWHTYWKNSGDPGQPTALTWTLPTGVLAGDIAWPLPHKMPLGTLMNYGYDGSVLLPVPLTITPDFKPSPLAPALEIKLQATWLVCRQECVPQEGEFVLSLPVKSSTALNASVFEAALLDQPRALTQPGSITLDGQQIKLSVPGLPASLQGQKLDVFPETPEVIEPAGPWTQAWQGDVWTASLPMAVHRGADPTQMPIVLVAETAGQRSGYLTQAQVSGTWPALAPVAESNPAAALPVAPLPASVPTSFWLALAGALLGGMILNLMPCVFPVLAIKVVRDRKSVV